MKKRIAVVLSGCGVFDGTEIREAVLTLLYLDQHGAETVCLAPNIPQLHVFDHLKGAVASGESRNVLVESARIARGEIEDIANAELDSLDAAIFPGGFGAAKNLCTFAVDGPEASIDPTTDAFVKRMHAAGKPLGFACIAPAVAAKSLGHEQPELTIGIDADTASALEKMGARHIELPVTEAHVDRKHKIVSTPAYMYEAPLAEIARGIEKMIKEVIDLI